MGGFGNLLFQINYGCHISKYNFKVEFCTLLLNSAFLHRLIGWTNHNSFNCLLDFKFTTFDQFVFVKGKYIDLILLFLSRKLGRSVFGRSFQSGSSSTRELNKSVYAGYFQSRIPISPNLISFLKDTKHELLHERISDPHFNYLYKLVSKSVVVHFRGGDFIGKACDMQSTNYYKNALKNYDEYVVLTNDIKNAREYFSINFPDDNVIYISSPSAISDFLLLATANTLISSASTFCWWASEIGDAIIVYQPKNYNIENWNPLSTRIRIDI